MAAAVTANVIVGRLVHPYATVDRGAPPPSRWRASKLRENRRGSATYADSRQRGHFIKYVRRGLRRALMAGLSYVARADQNGATASSTYLRTFAELLHTHLDWRRWERLDGLGNRGVRG